MTDSPHVLELYVDGLRQRVALSTGDEAKRAWRHFTRLQDRIAEGRPVVVTGETLLRDVSDAPGVERGAWYHLRRDGSIDYLREYRGTRDTPPAPG